MEAGKLFQTKSEGRAGRFKIFRAARPEQIQHP